MMNPAYERIGYVEHYLSLARHETMKEIIT